MVLSNLGVNFPEDVLNNDKLALALGYTTSISTITSAGASRAVGIESGQYQSVSTLSSISEAAAKIKELTGIERKETQVRKFLKSLGFRCLQVGVVPARAMTEVKKTSKRNIWTKHLAPD